LGWGVQSFGLAAMAALGDLPPVDVALHADTTHERGGTYAFAAKWSPWLEAHGVRVVTVWPKDAGVMNRFGGVMLPAYTGDRGQVRRQCTRDWKIRPIRRWLQANRAGRAVEVQLGISVDEITRVKPSDVAYLTNSWPLVERRMSREDVRRWLEKHGIEVPPRSACVFCPFQSRAEWRGLGLGDWAAAVGVDEAVRGARLPGLLYVHPQRVALAHADLRSEHELGQLGLWDGECTGLCGV
jgi:hypothetical protein